MWALESAYWLLIGRRCVSLDWWCVVDTWHPTWQHVATWSGVGPTGPTWYQDGDLILCISLSSGLRSRQMIYPFRSSPRARRNGAIQFSIWDCYGWCPIGAIDSLALKHIISCAFWCILQQKLETPTLVEIISIRPYSSVDDPFTIILCRYWRCKSSTFRPSTTPPHLTFAHSE